ncbi:hypothetical protein ABES80_12265 [Bacillus gobiensis]|uniref:hypothetical protein n=1 Tax=Bacillus gobiensis TaxID=1441095 RepID=UPI003D1A15E8
MLKYYEIAGKLVVKFDNNIDIDSVESEEAVRKTLKETGCNVAYVSTNDRKENMIIENETLSLEDLMMESPSVGGRSRKSKAVSAQKLE